MRVAPEQIKEWRRRQWARNVARLKRYILNILTLGLGENLWYGDILYQDLNVPLFVRCRRFFGINLNNLKIAVSPRRSGGEQIANAGNKRERCWYRCIRLSNRYELDVVVFRKCARQPNGESKEGQAVDCSKIK